MPAFRTWLSWELGLNDHLIYDILRYYLWAWHLREHLVLLIRSDHSVLSRNRSHLPSFPRLPLRCWITNTQDIHPDILLPKSHLVYYFHNNHGRQIHTLSKNLVFHDSTSSPGTLRGMLSHGCDYVDQCLSPYYISRLRIWWETIFIRHLVDLVGRHCDILSLRVGNGPNHACTFVHYIDISKLIP